MYELFTKDMDWSSALFANLVWPLLRDRIGGGELLQMENRPDHDLAQVLDTKAGIDAFQVRGDLMRGIACRCQVGTDYRTFTIRKSRHSGTRTEYDKRLEAISSPGCCLFPALTIQAYAKTETGPILSAGAAYTKDVFSFIQEGKAGTKPVNNATFWVVPWRDFEMSGRKIEIVTPIHGAPSWLKW